MTKIFGANYWTTLWGFITVAAGAIAIQPEIIAFLPDSWEPTVKGLAVFIMVISGGTFAVGVKSKNVTGGTVQQTADGSASAKATPAVIETLNAPSKP